ncbi:hypothetical protein GCM10022234_00760 [Aeromicrobium panaciterrae]|uniref:hypothetical protein n=1 Tax=Aeromicrobium panaciterrae TaxID=363861 RepID=UPI0031DA3675
MTITDEPQVNIPLLRKAVEWVEAEADKPLEICQWLQGDWINRPSDRARMVEHYRSDDEFAVSLRAKTPDCGTCYCIAGYVDQVILGNPEPFTDSYVETRAAEALGLSDNQADRLFHSDNTVEDVRALAEEFAGERL